jgi:hypothetical protein
VLDSDTLFLDEPALLGPCADVAVRPVDLKGSATIGPDDEFDPYWAALCELAEMPIDQLPFLETTVDRVKVRSSYNGGYSVVRRDTGVLQRAAEIFTRSVSADLRPFKQRPNFRVLASTGLVSALASEYWGSSQAALSIAIWSSTRRVHTLEARYNVPLHLLVQSQYWRPEWIDQPPVHVHYHWMLDPEHRAEGLELLRRLGVPPDRLDWVVAHLPLSYRTFSDQTTVRELEVLSEVRPTSQRTGRVVHNCLRSGEEMNCKNGSAPENSSPVRRAAILILGCGRSGTSVLAHLLNVLGTRLPEQLLGAGPGNPLGHWEPVRLLEINEEILRMLGSTCHDARPIPPGWFRSSAAYDFQERISHEIGSCYGDASLILIKEPRICRLAPLYLDALDALGIQTLIILLVRHPVEVMRSIYERDGGDMRTHEFKWLRHLIESEEATRTCVRTWTSFDDVLNNWPATVRSISQGLGITWPNEPENVSTEVANIVRPRHRHFRITDDPVPLPLGVLATRAWQAALHALGGDEPSARGLFDEIRRTVNEIDRLGFPEQESLERRLATAEVRSRHWKNSRHVPTLLALS